MSIIINVKNLTKSHISFGIYGEKWIFTHRQKMESASKIPILPVTQIIIDKYENHPQSNNQEKSLPILSNQKMNAYLKEIAAVCEIEKELTPIARHTFATTITLTNGVPIESVSKMLGHKNLRITQHYSKVLDRKVSDDMRILKDKFSSIFKLNRNNAIQNAQGNRNPFIDNPYLATLIWNEPTTTDSWNALATNQYDIAELIVYPTVTSDIVYITNTTNEPYQYYLTNTYGQQVASNTTINTIDVSNYASGLYFLTLKANNQTKTVKIIKQ